MKQHLSLSRLMTLTCLIVGAATPLQAAPAREDIEPKTLPKEATASVWTLPKTDEMVTLLTFKQPAPVKTTLGVETLIAGICVHCQIALKCRADELGKRCTVCSCELSNSQCLTGKGNTKNWTDMFKTLPPGTALRVEYTDPNKPETGLKRLTIDRHKALFSVDGLAGLTSEELVKINKPAGVTGVERSEDGKRLQLTLKDDWTTEKETRFEKALAKVGAKIVIPDAQL